MMKGINKREREEAYESEMKLDQREREQKIGTIMNEGKQMRGNECKIERQLQSQSEMKQMFMMSMMNGPVKRKRDEEEGG